MHLPPELDFLSPFLIKAKEEYRSACWLLSDFDDPVWRISFEFKTYKELDWRVVLDDGSTLTESRHKQLLDSFKYYLTSCTRISSSFLAEAKGQRQQHKRFRAACHIIDLLLINSKRYKLSSHGLGGLTSGNLIEILETIASTPHTTESIYNWTNRAREYCLNLVKRTDSNEISIVLKSLPEIGLITNEQLDDDILGISYDLIPQVRAALYLRNFYHNQVPYGKQPNTFLLAQDIYHDTLRGKSLAKPVHPILCFNSDTSTFKKEYRSAPVKSGQHERMIDNTYYFYRSTLYSLGLLHEIPLPSPPLEALIEAERYMPDLSTLGRFRTVPSDIVFKAVRQAIEFHLDHGQEITKAFCRVALECRKRNISPSSLTHEEVQYLVGQKLASLGVNRLCLSTRVRGSAKSKTRSNVKGKKNEYFENLRRNSGLYELIMVYIGCIQLTIGVLMARRASELYELKAADCLDETETWLMFKNAKSTRHLFGHRRRQARPIEPIAVDMVKTLIRMQKVLQRIGYIRKLKTLFAVPTVTGAPNLTESSVTVYNRNLDMFCDYFETPLNAAGERYYFRQHQMRRFFAMLFFYCGSFAKLDTLQWMLGHADPKHVYHYITGRLQELSATRLLE